MFTSRAAEPRTGDARAATPTLAVEELRVGMFIHLEGGWLSHPFALSSFRIANVQQLATLRGLKLRRVRWSPEQSDPAVLGGGGMLGGHGPGHTERVAAEPPIDGGADNGARHSADSGAGSDPHSTEPACAQPAEANPTAQRRAALAAQREVQQQCERHFAEATAAWRGAGDRLAADPAAACAGATALAGSLTDKLMVDGEVGIRLLPAAGNDRLAAHALNVTVVALLLGRTLGLSREELAELALGALLHDVGKLELPERARHLDAGALPADATAYREHVARGVGAARRMALSAGALAVIAQHHEQTDGGGFPLRLGAERISLPGRIVAIVNRYDTLCNPATRTPPLTPHEAVAMLFAHGRTRYDPAVLNAFIRMMGVYPAGSLVQLTDERYAIVMAANSTRPLKPRVLVHEADVPRDEALLLDLEHEPDIGIRRSLTAAKMPAAALQYLDPRPRVAYFFEPLSGSPGHGAPGATGATAPPTPSRGSAASTSSPTWAAAAAPAAREPQPA